MDNIYALLIFVAVVFVVYQADRLLQTNLNNRGKKQDDNDNVGVETQDVESDDLSEPAIAPAEPPNSTSSTKDEMIHDLAEENTRLMAEVDRLRQQIAALVNEEEDEDGGALHRVE